MGRKATANEILAAEHLLGFLFNEASVGFGILDTELRYLAVNSRLAEMHGVSAESHVGKTLREILGEHAPRVESFYRRVVTTGEPVLNLKIDGKLAVNAGRRWIDNLFPIKDASGNVTQVCAVITEINVTQVCAVVTEAKARIEGTQAESSADRQSSVLRSWKDIAQYVGTCVKTVQRWEHAYAFPVRRLKPSKGSVVFALRHDIDAWMLATAQTRNC